MVKAALAFLGSTAVEGSPIKWAAMHRCHHQHSDHDHDPHSPHHHGGGVAGVLKGFWHAHVGWIFRGDPQDLERYNPDLRADRVTRVMSRLWTVWAAMGFVIPAVLGGLLTWSWWGVLLGFVWGGLVRLLVVHHVTWSINSVCHIWGTRPFQEQRRVAEQLVLRLVRPGRGVAQQPPRLSDQRPPRAAVVWEFDASYLVIRAMELMGLVYDVKVPNRARMDRKRMPRRRR